MDSGVSKIDSDSLNRDTGEQYALSCNCASVLLKLSSPWFKLDPTCENQVKIYLPLHFDTPGIEYVGE